MFDSDFSQGPYAGVGSPSGAAHFPDVLSFREAWPFVQHAPSPFLGVDGQFDPVNTGRVPHILVSSSTGSGKSTVARSLAAQHMARGGAAVFLDVKRHSHRWAKDLAPNARYASTLPDVGNALVELGKEVHKRNYKIERFHGAVEDCPVGPPIMVIFEEMNATVSQLKSLDKKLPKGSYTAMDAFMDCLFMGRAAKVQFVCLAQLATFRAMGGSEVVENFDLKILLQYSSTAWKWLGEGPYQPAPAEVGRGMVVQGGKARVVQFMDVSEDDARRFVLHAPMARTLASALTPPMRRLPSAWRGTPQV